MSDHLNRCRKTIEYGGTVGDSTYYGWDLSLGGGYATDVCPFRSREGQDAFVCEVDKVAKAAGWNEEQWQDEWIAALVAFMYWGSGESGDPEMAEDILKDRYFRYYEADSVDQVKAEAEDQAVLDTLGRLAENFDPSWEGKAETSPWVSDAGGNFTCKSCGRPEGECSINPCDGVIEDRKA